MPFKQLECVENLSEYGSVTYLIIALLVLFGSLLFCVDFPINVPAEYRMKIKQNGGYDA